MFRYLMLIVYINLRRSVSQSVVVKKPRARVKKAHNRLELEICSTLFWGFSNVFRAFLILSGYFSALCEVFATVSVRAEGLY